MHPFFLSFRLCAFCNRNSCLAHQSAFLELCVSGLSPWFWAGLYSNQMENHLPFLTYLFWRFFSLFLSSLLWEMERSDPSGLCVLAAGSPLRGGGACPVIQRTFAFRRSLCELSCWNMLFLSTPSSLSLPASKYIILFLLSFQLEMDTECRYLMPFTPRMLSTGLLWACLIWRKK